MMGKNLLLSRADYGSALAGSDLAEISQHSKTMTTAFRQEFIVSLGKELLL